MGKEDGIVWKERLATFDFEVTKHDWLLVIKEKTTGKYHSFHNDPQGVEEFIELAQNQVIELSLSHLL